MSSTPLSGEPVVQRPRRGPQFDPKTQPWEPADPKFGAVPADVLSPDFIRAVLGRPIEPTSLEIPRELPVSGYESRTSPVPAAVLVPMVMREHGLTVLLTQRTAHLHDHAGQVSFPGGRVEPEDPNPVATALRETLEETGLAHHHVDVIGRLPQYFTGTGFSITPVTALVRPDFELAPDSFEVAEVFEVPLAFLTDPRNYRLHLAQLPDGAVRRYFSVPWQQFFIWGATAAMLRGMYQVLAQAFSENRR